MSLSGTDPGDSDAAGHEDVLDNPTRPAQAAQLSPGWDPACDPREPICHSGHAVPGSRADRFPRPGRALPCIHKRSPPSQSPRASAESREPARGPAPPPAREVRGTLRGAALRPGLVAWAGSQEGSGEVFQGPLCRRSTHHLRGKTPLRLGWSPRGCSAWPRREPPSPSAAGREDRRPRRRAQLRPLPSPARRRPRLFPAPGTCGAGRAPEGSGGQGRPLVPRAGCGNLPPWQPPSRPVCSSSHPGRGLGTGKWHPGLEGQASRRLPFLEGRRASLVGAAGKAVSTERTEGPLLSSLLL